MALEQYAYLAEIIGVILVIASLVYVARQLRQNTAAILAQSRQAMLSASQSELFALLDHPGIHISAIKHETLTAEEQMRLGAWLMGVMRARQFAWLQYRNGVIDESQWETEEAVIRAILDTSRARDWWFRLGRVSFGDEFADFVDSVITVHPPSEVVYQAWTNWATS
jgi:hypothetical protein